MCNPLDKDFSSLNKNWQCTQCVCNESIWNPNDEEKWMSALFCDFIYTSHAVIRQNCSGQTSILTRICGVVCEQAIWHDKHAPECKFRVCMEQKTSLWRSKPLMEPVLFWDDGTACNLFFVCLCMGVKLICFLADVNIDSFLQYTTYL